MPGVCITKSDHGVHIVFTFNKIAGISLLVIVFNALLLVVTYFSDVS